MLFKIKMQERLFVIIAIMHPFILSEITTKDGLIQQGIYFAPSHKKNTAILWIHGLTSTFYSGLERLSAFTQLCEKEGWGFAAFNNRGHDVMSGAKKIDPSKEKGYSRVNVGSAYENFEESVHDIEAGIEFLASKGFTSIILIGQSSGANKVCYYAATQAHKNLAGVILASPVSDRLDPEMDKKVLAQNIKTAQTLIASSKGESLVTFGAFPMTAARFVSLYNPGSLEDQFDYGDEHPKLAYFSKITLPLLVLLGEEDLSLDRPPQKHIEVFDRLTSSKRYKSIILPGVNHNYQGSEKLVIETIGQWIASI